MRQWMGVWALVVVAACAAGGVAPEPTRVPAEAEDVREAEPAPPTAEAMARAADLLRRSREAYEAVELERALELAREVVTAYAGTESAPPARWLAARTAFSLGRYEEARRLALAYAETVSAAEDTVAARVLAELAADALEPPSAAPAVIGAVLPRSGPRVLVRYADWVLEGIELAVAEAERAQGRRIELVVADDSGGVRLREAMGELQRRGVLAIVGPLLPEHLQIAARSRRSGDLVLISPTAPMAPGGQEVYSVNAADGRGAAELGRYAADLGFGRAALLYPRLAESEQKARAFADAFEAAGGVVPISVPYDSGTTTFKEHMERILEHAAPGFVAARARHAGDPERPWEYDPPGFALFIPAPERDVPQIAPQVSFYGLDSAGVQLFGDAAWSSTAVRRLVPQRDLEGVIAVSHFPPGEGAAEADSAFIRSYEARYRRTLDNRLPALGYDAARLVLQALPNRRLTQDALARRFHFLAAIPGATGILSVRGGQVVRIPYLVVIREGMLEPAPYPWEYDGEDPVDSPPSDPSEEPSR